MACLEDQASLESLEHQASQAEKAKAECPAFLVPWDQLDHLASRVKLATQDSLEHQVTKGYLGCPACRDSRDYPATMVCQVCLDLTACQDFQEKEEMTVFRALQE